MAVVGVHEILLTPSLKGFQRSAGKQLDGTAGQVGETAGRTMGSRLGGALKTGLMVGGGAAIAGLGTALTKGFGRLRDIEQAQATLSGLGHSAESVERIMVNANSAVKGTAFGLGDAATVAASAVAAGIKPGESLERTLKLVGDAATIGGTSMSDMGSIVNKVATSDMMQMDVANQLMDAGIPIMQLVAEEMGVSAEEARKMASAGEVSFETFQNAMEDGMGGAAQKSGETLTGAFNNSMAAIGRFGANLIQDVYPQVRDFFTGFIEWMGPVEEMGAVIGEKLGQALQDLTGWVRDSAMPALSNFADWVRDNKTPIMGVAAAVTGLFVGFKLYTAVVGVIAWIHKVKAAMILLNAAMRANPIGIVITIIGALIAIVIWAYNEFDWFKNIVDTVFKAVTDAISWAWNNVIKPVFEAIADFVVNTLAPAFQWFWENVIAPVFGWIGDRISETWNGIIKPVLDLMVDVFKNIVGPAISAFWESRVKPAFDSIGSFIKDTWNNVIKPVLDAFAGFIQKHVAPGIEKGVEIIGNAWAAVKKMFATPINWVLQTVWNDGIKKAFDNVAKAVGSDARLGAAPLIPTGDSSSARGNRSGSGGIGTVGKFAKGGLANGWAIVGEEGPELVNFSQPGRVYTADQTRDAMGDFNWGNAGDELKRQLGIGRILGTDQIGAGTEWIVGGLADAAKALVNPLLSKARGGLAGTMGSLAGGFISSIADKVFGFATKQDAAMAGGEFAGDFEGSAGSFRRPSRGPITSRYGRRWGSHHAGIDIAGGGPTYAAWNGVVAKTGWNIGPGRTGIGILLNHGNRHSYYGHNPVGGVKVRPGQQVKAGQRIGAQGSTGNVTGKHLHFEEHRGKAWNDVNPGYLFRDKGGNLPPGLSMVLNNTGGDEWIFNRKQLGQLDRAVTGQGIDYDRLGDVLADRLDGMAVQMDGRSTIGALKSNRAWAGAS